MLPWGHLAIGYLVYTTLSRVRRGRAPRDGPTLALALATQLPDLVDKPLNWWFGVFDGRGAGHSLLAVIAVCVLAFVVAREYDRPDVAGVLSVGLFTHLLADAWQPVLSGQFARATFLLWPLRAAPTYPKDSVADHVAVWGDQFGLLLVAPGDVLTSPFGVQLVLSLVAIVVWAGDGFPGLGTTWRLLTNRRLSSDRTTDR